MRPSPKCRTFAATNAHALPRSHTDDLMITLARLARVQPLPPLPSSTTSSYSSSDAEHLAHARAPPLQPPSSSEVTLAPVTVWPCTNRMPPARAQQPAASAAANSTVAPRSMNNRGGKFQGISKTSSMQPRRAGDRSSARAAAAPPPQAAVVPEAPVMRVFHVMLKGGSHWQPPHPAPRTRPSAACPGAARHAVDACARRRRGRVC